MKKWYLLCLVFSGLISAQDDDYGNHQDYGSNTRIDSPQPYFKILNKNSKIDQIPLLMTAVDVNINGIVAEVQVTQYYKNFGDLPLEAQYVFPGSSDAAVYHLDMKVGDRIIAAEVAAKEEATKVYTKAKKAGKTASLLEQGDPGLFTMNVANILPNDDIQVTLKYIEKIVPSQGRYRFKYPAVGRPSVLAKGTTEYQSYKPGSDMGFDLTVKIDAPLAINSINSKHHEIELDWHSDQSVMLYLDSEETLNFKEDFIVDFDLRGEEINSGVALFAEEDAGYFLMMLQPPAEFKPTEVIKREYIFVVDSSGSMSNQPIENAKFIASALMMELTPEEYFNVVLFAGGSEILSNESLSATADNINEGLKMVDVSSAGGGTDLKSALEKINQIPHIDGIARSLIVLTDGAIMVSHQTIDLIRKTPNQNVFVIGVSAGHGNDNVAIDEIADAGQGLSFYATDDNDIEQLQSQFLDYVRYPLLTDIEINTIGFDSVDIFPQRAVDLFAQKPLYVTGMYTGNKRGTIEIKGRGNGRNYQHLFDLDGLNNNSDNEPIKYLWAKEKIHDLMYEQQSNEEEITALGLSHNLLTQFTSFVAVDQIIRSDGTLEKVTKSPYSESISGYGFAENAVKIEFKPNLKGFKDWAKDDIQPLTANLSNDQIPRKSITFILGKDKSTTNQFYQTAEIVYGQDGEHKTDLVIDHLRDIKEVKAYLLNNTDIDSPWGIINIVSHSSPWSGLSNRSNSGVHQSMNLFSLHDLITDKGYQPLINQIVDGFTEIRLIGCALGRQQHMLKALSVYFGGQDHSRPVVKAPVKHVYLKQNEDLKSGHIYSFDVPWFISNSAQFDSSKSEQFGIEKGEWKSQLIEISFNIPDSTFVHKKYLKKLISEQVLLNQFLSDMDVTTDEFNWQLKSLKGQSTQLVGKAYLITTEFDSVVPEWVQPIDFEDIKMVSVAK